MAMEEDAPIHPQPPFLPAQGMLGGAAYNRSLQQGPHGVITSEASSEDREATGGTALAWSLFHF